MSYKPISKNSTFNTAIVLNTDFFTDDLEPTNFPTMFRIYVVMDDAGVLTVKRTKAGVTVDENSTLLADTSHLEDIVVDEDETINLQYSVNSTILKLSVVEVPNMV